MLRRLILILLALPLCLAAPAGAAEESPTHRYIRGVAGGPTADRFSLAIERAARRYRLDPVLVARVIRLESSYNVREVSHVGATGLMQVMPVHFRRRGIPRRQWMEPATNLDLGCRVLAWYLDLMGRRYPGLAPEPLLQRTLVAYNMGPRAVVSRGIYRSRYSDIILARYLQGLGGPRPPSLDPFGPEALPPVDLTEAERALPAAPAPEADLQP